MAYVDPFYWPFLKRLTEIVSCFFTSAANLKNCRGLPLYFVLSQEGFQGEWIAATKFVCPAR